MQTQEKKYVVESLEPFEKLLLEAGAVFLKQSQADHYYAKLPTNDVIKLVVSDGKAEIMKLSDVNGQFKLTERITCDSLEDGVQQIKAMGYDQFNVVHMDHRDYEFKGGVVGLYDIDGTFDSIVLDYAPGQHDAVADMLGLTEEQTLTTPYNVRLEKLGKIRDYIDS